MLHVHVHVVLGVQSDVRGVVEGASARQGTGCVRAEAIAMTKCGGDVWQSYGGGAVFGYSSSTISISGSSFTSNTASVRTKGRGEEGVWAGYVGVGQGVVAVCMR